MRLLARRVAAAAVATTLMAVSACRAAEPAPTPATLTIDTLPARQVVLSVSEGYVGGIKRLTAILADGTAYSINPDHEPPRYIQTVPPDTVRSLVNLVATTVRDRSDRNGPTDGMSSSRVVTDQGEWGVTIDHPRTVTDPPETAYVAMLETVYAEVERTGSAPQAHEGPFP